MKSRRRIGNHDPGVSLGLIVLTVAALPNRAHAHDIAALYLGASILGGLLFIGAAVFKYVYDKRRGPPRE